MSDDYVSIDDVHDVPVMFGNNELLTYVPAPANEYGENRIGFIDDCQGEESNVRDDHGD